MIRSGAAVLCCAWVCVGLSAAASAAAAPNQGADMQRCRERADIDACYDAIRWNPTDPALLSALGDAFARQNRSADALRTYKRAETLAPGNREIAAKVGAIQAKLSAKRTSKAHAEIAKRYSNAEPVSQSH
jgi:cytochrome c-type biogenesis protein CcmH/NrfG